MSCLFYSFNGSGEILLYTGSHYVDIPNSVCVWGCLSVKCKSVLKKLDGRLDTRQYMEVLHENVVPFCQYSRLIHDHYPVHTAQAVRKFLKSHGVAVVEDWPKKSGDIMPLETVWLHIINKLNESNILAFDKAGLWSELCQLWQSLDLDGYFTQLISDMPERLQNIIRKDGAWTR